MKKLMCVTLCVLLLAALSVPVFADTEAYDNIIVQFADDSTFEAGTSVRVDKEKMMTDGNIYAEQYNALLEGRVQFFWYCNGSYYGSGESVALAPDSGGSQIYCVAELYNDMECTDLFGTISSYVYVVSSVDEFVQIPIQQDPSYVTEDGNAVVVMPLRPSEDSLVTFQPVVPGSDYVVSVYPEIGTGVVSPDVQFYGDTNTIGAIGGVAGPEVVSSATGLNAWFVSILCVLGIGGTIAIVAGLLLLTAAIVILIIMIAKKKKKNK